MSRAGLGLAALAAVPLGFLVVFFAWPVGAILRLGFVDGGVLDALTEGETCGWPGSPSRRRRVRR